LVAKGKHCDRHVLHGQGGELHATADEQRVAIDQDRGSSLFRKMRKRNIDVAVGAGRERFKL